MEKKYYELLYKLAKKAYIRNEIPVSALIVWKGKVIAKAYNKKNLSKNPLLHAEIICLQKAYKKLKRWNLNDCEMYVSLEPCDMCKHLIEESRIDYVYYILKKGNCNNKYKKTQYEQMYVDKNVSFQSLLENFFKKLRK